ncbi:MAG: hypothetical protein LKJ75_05110 [Clostridia bacterium]|jgi:hypothetical protein|nr:hypothetical protein [Clostridia bacterium]MCI2014562.1 hypothetical protein [Clostridia bacterium]
MEEYIEICKTIFETYTGVSYDSTNNAHVICVSEMAKCHKNRENNEGLVSFSGSGISESYESLYPKYIIVMLEKFRKKVKLL